MDPPSEPVATSERAPILRAREPERVALIRRANRCRRPLRLSSGVVLDGLGGCSGGPRIRRVDMDATTLDPRDRRLSKKWLKELLFATGLPDGRCDPRPIESGASVSCFRSASLPNVFTHSVRRRQ